MCEGGTITCAARYRYRQADQPVEATLKDGKLYLHSLTPQRAVTPGQSAVLYDGDICLGGGIITEVGGFGRESNSIEFGY
jgi:tRNA-specific 2-thiouridylase